MAYKTKQREAILRFFMDHGDRCFSAREVWEQVDAGEATVFRAITALTESGLLKKYVSGTGKSEAATYQYNACGEHADHIHLRCERCGELFHMDCSFMAEILRHFKTEHGFDVDCGKTVIYGVCERCGKEIQA